MWEEIAAVAGVAGVAVAIWQLYGGPAKGGQIQQRVLDALPTAPTNDSIVAYQKRGMDTSTLQASLSISTREMNRALKQLISEHKVQIAVIRAVSDGSDNRFPAGTIQIVPLLFKGGISPSLRATDADLEAIVTSFDHD